jgi:hypothetical protein
MATQSNNFVEYFVDSENMVERPFTEIELEQYKYVQDNAVLEKQKQKTQETAKATAQAKLAALGLTVEDLQALGL